MEMPQEQHQENPQLAKLAGYLYMIFSLSILMQGMVQTMILGNITLLIALIIAYAKRGAVKGTWIETHYQWMIRTFWIGGGVYLPIVTLLGFFWIYSHVDIAGLQAQMYEGTITDPMMLAQQLEQEAEKPMREVFIVLGLPFAIWWLYRCWHGYRLLMAAKPIADVKSWI